VTLHDYKLEMKKFPRVQRPGPGMAFFIGGGGVKLLSFFLCGSKSNIESIVKTSSLLQPH